MFERNGALLLKRFGSYFFPTILMSVALSMSIVVDGIIVGNMLGPDALAAVNLGLPLMQGYAALFVFFGMGGAVLAAWHMGRHELAAAGTVFTVAAACLLACGLVCATAGTAFMETLAILLSGGTALAEPLRRYLEPLVWGAPLLIVTPGLSYFVRTDGRPGLASAILITANVANLICDVLFIYWLDDIAGAAWATVTGYGVALGPLAFYLAAPRRVLRFTLTGGPLSARLGGVLRSGLPGGLNIGLQFLKLFCLNMLVLSVAGKSGMVAFSVCLACLSLASMFISGASQTMMPIMGVLYGEGDHTGMRIVFRRALTVLLCGTAGLIAVLMIFPRELLALFGISGGDMALGERAVRLFAPSLLGDAFAMLMMYYAQTIQRQMVAVTAAVLQSVAILLPCAWLFSRWWGLDGIWLSFSVAGALTALALLALTRGVAARAKGAVAGLLMLPPDSAQTASLDVSLSNTLEAAVGLSARVTAFCREQGLDGTIALRAGIIVEEMAVNTVRHGGVAPGSGMLDVRLHVRDEDVRIAFRDTGRPFNPLEYTPERGAESAGGGIPLIRTLGARLEYSYALGFNNSVVTLPRRQTSP